MSKTRDEDLKGRVTGVKQLLFMLGLSIFGGILPVSA